jgi:hypothetical protein
MRRRDFITLSAARLRLGGLRRGRSTEERGTCGGANAERPIEKAASY